MADSAGTIHKCQNCPPIARSAPIWTNLGLFKISFLVHFDSASYNEPKTDLKNSQDFFNEVNRNIDQSRYIDNLVVISILILKYQKYRYIDI